MLVEILIVVTVIVTSMIFLFVQISNMNNSYDEVKEDIDKDIFNIQENNQINKKKPTTALKSG